MLLTVWPNLNRDPIHALPGGRAKCLVKAYLTTLVALKNSTEYNIWPHWSLVKFPENGKFSKTKNISKKVPRMTYLTGRKLS